MRTMNIIFFRKKKLNNGKMGSFKDAEQGGWQESRRLKAQVVATEDVMAGCCWRHGTSGTRRTLSDPEIL